MNIVVSLVFELLFLSQTAKILSRILAFRRSLILQKCSIIDIWQGPKWASAYTATLKTRFKKTKHAKFSEKTNISYPLIRTRTPAYLGVRNTCFSENLAALFSYNNRFERRPIALLPTIFAHEVKFYESLATVTYSLSFPVVCLQSCM